MARRNQTSSRWRAALFVAISVLPLLLLAYLATTAANSAAEQQARARISASADVSAAFVLEQIRGVENLIEATAQRRAFIEAVGAAPESPRDLPELKRQMAEVVTASVGVNDISVFEPDGTLVATYPPDDVIIGEDFSYRDYFRGVRRTGRTYVSEAYISRTRRLHVVGVATPVRAPDGRLVAVVQVQVEVDETQAFVERFAAAQGVSLMVTDQRGAPVAAQGGVPRLPRRIVTRADDPRVARALRGESGVIETDGSLSAYRPIPELGWTISASIPARQAYREASRAEALIIVGAVLLAVAMLVALYALLRRLHRYESELHEQVAKAEHGKQLLEDSNRQLKASNSALDAFSHTLAHDLRNPLTTVGGFARTLSSAAASREQEELRVMADHIVESASRMERLIADVLELATLARVAPQRAEVDPRRVALEAASHIDGLELEFGQLPSSISANRSSLYRSFKNLLENAAAYGHAPDEPAQVRISADESATHWCFYVDDRGPGVSAIDQRHIFSPFQRGAQGAGRAGTGLGLAIVGASAESHGGTVRVEAAPGGVGARFVYTIAKPVAGPVNERETVAGVEPARTDAQVR